MGKIRPLFTHQLFNYFTFPNLPSDLKRIQIYGELLDSISSILINKGEYKLAFEKLNQALEIQTKLNDNLGIGKTFIQLGHIHQNKGEYGEALEKYNDALEIQTELGDRSGIAMTNAQLGVFYRKKEDLLTSLVSFLTANRIFSEIGDVPDYLKTLMEIATTVDPKDLSTIPDIKDYLLSAMEKVHDIFSEEEDETIVSQIDALISELKTSI